MNTSTNIHNGNYNNESGTQSQNKNNGSHIPCSMSNNSNSNDNGYASYTGPKIPVAPSLRRNRSATSFMGMPIDMNIYRNQPMKAINTNIQRGAQNDGPMTNAPQSNNDQMTSVTANDNMQMAPAVQSNTTMMCDDPITPLPRINSMYNENTMSVSSFARMNNDNFFGNASTNTLRNNQFISCGQSSNNNQPVGTGQVCERNSVPIMHDTQSNDNRVTNGTPMGMSFRFNFPKKSMMRTEMIIVPPTHTMQDETLFDSPSTKESGKTILTWDRQQHRSTLLSFNELAQDAPELPRNEELRRYGVYVGYRESKPMDIELTDDGDLGFVTKTPEVVQKEENQITPQKNLKRCTRDQDSDAEHSDDDDDEIDALCNDLSKRVRMEKTAAEVALRNEVDLWNRQMCFSKNHPAICPREHCAFWSTRLNFNRKYDQLLEINMKFPEDYPQKPPVVTQSLPLIRKLPGITYAYDTVLGIPILRNWHPSYTVEDIIKEILDILHH
jgi:hypothetical protein